MPQNKHLVIIQNRPTQFDAPLYAFLEQRAPFALTVYYTEATHENDKSVDPETGQIAHWDHLQGCRYQWHVFSGQELASAGRAADKIHAHDPDLVVISGYSPLFHAKLAWALKRKGVRIGLRSDNTARHSLFHGWKGLAKRYILPLLLRQYDTWHPVGTLARQYFEQISGVRKPTFLFPYNVDNSWFAGLSHFSENSWEAQRRSLSISRNTFVVLGILKWNEREDPMTLIQGFSRFVEHCPDACLVLVGDGPLRPDIEQSINKLHKHVVLPGYVPYSALPALYGIADVFVHPAVGEPWGVSVNEAMACGVPVLAAKGVGAGEDLVVEGKTGFVFSDGDDAELGQKLIYCADNRQMLAAMGRAAERKVAQWSYQQTLQEFARALK